uniref:C2H2-type domain-containing protein n=1 Tax=Oryctolagus cuniculus TaxID=9986 RepID=A0A5F9C2Q6_RABIT
MRGAERKTQSPPGAVEEAQGLVAVGNGLAAGSSDSSGSGSGSDSEEPLEGQPAKASVAAAAAVTPTSPVGSSGLITQEGVHIPFDVHHVESLAEQGAPLCPNPAGSGPEALETVVCVPVPVQEDLYVLKKEEQPALALAELAATVPESAQPEAEADGEELEGGAMSAIIYEIPKEPEKRRRSKRARVTDADGLLEMFHCPYEGCSQVYVALSSFQNHVNLVHRKGKTKVCPHPGCGKKFYLSNHLRRHMIIHSGVREFTFETCVESFKRNNHLEWDRLSHPG